MVPTNPSTLAPSPNPWPSKRLHRLRRQTPGVFYRLPGKSSLVHRQLNPSLQPSVGPPEGPPPPIVPVLSDPVGVAPEPTAASISNSQPQGSSQPDDVPGNIVAAIVIVVLVVGGLIGLVIGGEMIRRRTRIAGERNCAPPHSKGRQKPKSRKGAGPQQQERAKGSREIFPCNEKMTVTSPLARPPPVLNRERQKRFSGVWPIRAWSRALRTRRSCPEQVERDSRHFVSSVATPQTTWSEFTPVSLYVPPPRTILDRIPEELEECESQTDGKPGPEGMNQPRSSVGGAERRGSNTTATDDDGKSLGSSAPDMTSDEDESSRSSMASLESLEDKNDRESLREEVFELKRAQTRSMQMNKGVLLSLSFHSTLNDSPNLESTGGKLGQCDGPSRSSCAPNAVEMDYVERELSLAILGGSFSAVNLDEFPSPPSILPMIPSFVSGF